MKFFLPLFLMISLPALSAPCKVYGISDGPQMLNCTFEKNFKARLHCSRGHFLLDGIQVDKAFHLDVETGASPLVFKTSKSTLTVIKDKSSFSAELENAERTLSGRCL